MLAVSNTRKKLKKMELEPQKTVSSKRGSKSPKSKKKHIHKEREDSNKKEPQEGTVTEEKKDNKVHGTLGDVRKEQPQQEQRAQEQLQEQQGTQQEEQPEQEQQQPPQQDQEQVQRKQQEQEKREERQPQEPSPPLEKQSQREGHLHPNETLDALSEKSVEDKPAKSSEHLDVASDFRAEEPYLPSESAPSQRSPESRILPIAQFIASERQRRKTEKIVFSVMSELLTVLITMALGIYLATLILRPKKKETGTDFCCKAEVEELAEVVDFKSIEACINFHDYVCLKAKTRDRQNLRYIKAAYGKDIADDAAKPISTAASVLATYYKSCLSSLSQEEIHLFEVIVRALTRMELVKKAMTYQEVLFSLLANNVRYGTPSLINVHYSVSGDLPLLQIAYALDKERAHSYFNCAYCLDRAVGVFNELMETNITKKEVEDFETGLLGDYPKNCIPVSGNMTLLDSLFNSTSSESIAAMLMDLRLIDPGHELIVQVYCPAGITSLMVALSDPHQQPQSMAFLLAQTATRTLRSMQLSRRGNFLRSSIPEVCQSHVSRMHNMMNVFFIEENANREKDAEVRKISENILREISLEATTFSLFSKDDYKEVKRKLLNLTVTFPSLDVPTNLYLPNMSSDFIKNYFVGHNYEYLASRYKQMNRISSATVNNMFSVKITSNNNIIVSPVSYHYLKLNKDFSMLLNMPIVGMEIAIVFWQFLLYNTTWSNSTSSNLRDFNECFSEKYLNGREINDLEKDTIAAALALSSVKKSFQIADWNVEKRVSEKFNISHAKYFYVRQAYARCPTMRGRRYTDLINVPVQYIPDFATTFMCSEGTPMNNARGCLA